MPRQHSSLHEHICITARVPPARNESHPKSIRTSRPFSMSLIAVITITRTSVPSSVTSSNRAWPTRVIYITTTVSNIREVNPESNRRNLQQVLHPLPLQPIPTLPHVCLHLRDYFTNVLQNALAVRNGPGRKISDKLCRGSLRNRSPQLVHKTVVLLQYVQ